MHVHDMTVAVKSRAAAWKSFRWMETQAPLGAVHLVPSSSVQHQGCEASKQSKVESRDEQSPVPVCCRIRTRSSVEGTLQRAARFVLHSAGRWRVIALSPSVHLRVYISNLTAWGTQFTYRRQIFKYRALSPPRRLESGCLRERTEPGRKSFLIWLTRPAQRARKASQSTYYYDFTPAAGRAAPDFHLSPAPAHCLERLDPESQPRAPGHRQDCVCCRRPWSS